MRILSAIYILLFGSVLSLVLGAAVAVLVLAKAIEFASDLLTEE